MAQSKSIAITGIGCRFPGGADGPGAFWRLLCDRVDAIREVPEDRWNVSSYYDPAPGLKGKSIARWGGFVDGIERFDPGFFGISPREAAFVDPQQRMLLRAAWEALEDGGEAPDALRGSAVGVFVGISTNDYASLQSTPSDNREIDIWTATGGVASIAANRISYCLDLRGPSVAVDTACSSSLVAVHLACRSLSSGECAMALAGGVNALIFPMPFISFSRSGMLSPDGRCKAFDARANGFVRAEGVGVIVLKPLADALEAGDPIYAVIRGTAVNQDGRTNGITVPSPAAQVELVRAACRDAGVKPRQVQYVESHGTGTSVGDPIEAEALGAALGVGREPGEPCMIGSVKTNIGHLEAGAGIAGLIKVALSLHHGRIPPNLHFETPNPRIDFEGLRLRVVREAAAYRDGGGPAVAGVNSFGFGGTNAHAILEAVPWRGGGAIAKGGPHLLTLSAQGDESLRGLAAEFREFLEAGRAGGGASLADICFTAGRRRSHHPRRLAAVGDTREEMVERLGAFLAGEARPGVSEGQPVPRPDPVFVFSGQGPQWWAMGRELLREEPVFGDTIAACDALLREFGGWSLLEELARDESSSRLGQTEIAQPAIFALQVALAALWEAWGIRPAAVVGHSVGEVAAAHVAGAMSLREATRVIFQRGRCMEMAPERGRMLATGLSWDQAQEAVGPFADRVSVAALNGPVSVALSGDGEALERIAGQLEGRGIFCRFLQVNYAFHSHQMDPVREELLRSLGRVEVGPARLCLMSTVTGAVATGPEFGTEYWWRNVRQPVLFATAIAALLERGHSAFLELSAHPVLGGSILETMARAGVRGTVLPSLRRKEPERATMLGSLGALHALGCRVDWSALYPAARAVRLPTYAWQLDGYWHEAEEWRESRLAPVAHPLLGRSLKVASPTWHAVFDLEVLPYLGDHRVQGRAVFPAAGYVEMALGAARAMFGPGACVVEEIDFQRPFFLPEGEEAARLELSFDEQGAAFSISGAAGGVEQNWVVHAVGRLRRDTGTKVGETRDLEEVVGRCAEEVSPAAIYQMFLDSGLGFGPSFRGIEMGRRGDGEAICRVRLVPGLEAESEKYQVHPAMLDACLQALSLAMPAWDGAAGRPLYLPVQIGRVRWVARPGRVVWSHAVLVQQGGRAITGDIRVLDEEGGVLLEIEGLRCQAVAGVRAGGDGDGSLYALRWKPRPLGRFLGSCDFLAPVSRVAERARGATDPAHLRRSGQPDIAELESGIDGVCRAYFFHALEQMGCPIGRGALLGGDLAGRLGIAPVHRGTFGCLLDLLERDGFAHRAEGGLAISRDVAKTDPGDLARPILERFPGALAELTLIELCGRGLADVLRGKAEPPSWLASDVAIAAAEHFFQDSYTCAAANRTLGEVVAAAIERRPEGRVLRILEVGAGTGGATAHILPRLPRGRAEYVFTDRSAEYFAGAEQKFYDQPEVRYQSLDVGRPPGEQGFEGHSFDVVVVAGALRATGDLERAMANLRSLVAPGGTLVIQEFRRPTWLGEMVLGVVERWQGPGEGDRWQGLLGEAGFTDVAAIDGDGGAPRHVTLIARAPMVAGPGDVMGRASGVERVGAGTWIFFADGGGLAEGVAGALVARGADAHVVHPGPAFGRRESGGFEICPESPDDARLLFREILGRGGPPLAGIVHLWGLDAPSPEKDGAEGLAAAEALACHSVVSLLQALGQEAAHERPGLWLITRGAQAVEAGDPVHVAQAPVWGLGRVISNECPRLGCRMIDLSPVPAGDEVGALVSELCAGDGEDEVAHRGAARYVQRLARTTLEQETSAAMGPEREGGFHLESVVPGSLDQLMFRGRPRRPPGRDEVEMEVKAAALNFRDVMKALGIYPTEGEEDLLLGDECAGRITAIGHGVVGWREGDEVLAIASGCFGSHVTIPANRLVRVPGRLGFDEASAIPVAFLTAWYALHHLGHVRPGERVLIQAATGGVGLAAVQVARLAGAEVLATAGNPQKREFLRAMGVRHVMDSRSLAFSDEVREITGGRGVDIVLNSLAGEAISKGITCLAPGGRFLEIGKRDIYQNTKIGLRAFRQNISLFVIDLARVIRDDPALVSGLLDQILARFREGELHPLPLRVFGASRAGQAFRHMSQARHIGKIVLSMEGDGVTPAREVDLGPPRFASDATYLITGGLGGFGLVMAEWMVGHGARHIVLASRGGAATGASQQAVEALRRAGAEVAVAQADVARREDVARLFEMIARQLPPLRGIVHAAMVIDDCTIAQQTPERFRRVMAPKVAGAWNLHERSADLPLDFFILFSSFSSVAGSPGQCSYAAANSFLDALASHRRARGRPGLAVNWGPLGGAGYLARHAELEAALHAQGFSSIGPGEATSSLGGLLRSGAAQVAVVRVDWQKVAGFVGGVATSARFEEVRVTSAAGEALGGAMSGEGILDLPEAERLPAVTEALKEQIAKVLRTSAAKLDIQRPLNTLGFDSLMSVELVNRIEGHFRVVLPAGKIASAGSTVALAGELLGLLARTPTAPVSVGPVSIAVSEVDAVTPPPADAAVAATLSPAIDGERLMAEEELAPARAPRGRWRDVGRRVQFRIEWLALLGGMEWLRRGDYSQACRRVRRLARCSRPLLRFNWLWAQQNLRLVFGPNLTDTQRRRLATLAFENHFISYLDGLRRDDVTFGVHGAENLLGARAQGRGVILCGAHLGGWEAALRLGSREGLPIAAVYRRAQNPLTDRLFQQIRSAYDVDWIVGADAGAAIDALRADKILGLMTDLNVTRGGTVADFLGVPARCPSGPARLALLRGCPIVPAVTIRTGEGRLDVHFEPAIEPPANDDSEAQVRGLTRRINAAFEPWVVEYAEQYNWLHPRWRCRPDGRELTLGVSGEQLQAERIAPFLAVPERIRALV